MMRRLIQSIIIVAPIACASGPQCPPPGEGWVHVIEPADCVTHDTGRMSRSTFNAIADQLDGLDSVAIIGQFDGPDEYIFARVSDLDVDRRQALDHDRFVLLVPDGPYLNLHDTYQLALEMPFVHLSHLSRESRRTSQFRKLNFPHIYGGARHGPRAALRDELQQLNVGYILFENKAALETFPFRGQVEMEWEDETLLRLAVR